MMDDLDGLPALDAHAHIATDVTATQVRALGHSHTFAMTRSLEEARTAPTQSSRLTWAIGVHPGVASAQAAYEERTFSDLLKGFGVVGEVGLDRSAGNLPRQIATLESILRVSLEHPVLISLHSIGASGELLEALAAHPHPGAILHWWTDEGPNLRRAVDSGVFFSVNAGVKPMILAQLPEDRILTETDFPAGRRLASRPGDTSKVEALLSDLWGVDPQTTRLRVWVNLRRLASRIGALDRLPTPLADLLDRV